MRVIGATIMVAAGVLLGAAQAAPAPARVAIVIGQNQPYQGQLEPLRFADDDAIHYVELFDVLGVESTLLTVMDDDTARTHAAWGERARMPTVAGVRRAFADANRRVEAAQAEGRRVDLLFVYAGHGERGGDGLGRLHLQDGTLSRAELIAALRASKADFNHVILDACHAESVVYRRGDDDGFRSRSFGPAVQHYLASEDISALPNTGVLLAASSSEATHEWSRIGSGVFSHEVRSALTGAADVNADGFVEYTEVAAYVSAANARIGARGARASVLVIPPKLDRNRPLSDIMAGGAAFLRLPVGWVRHAWLEDAAGARYAELHPSGEREVTLAVPPKGRWYLRTGAEETQLAMMTGKLTGPEDGPWRPLQLRTRGAVADDYDAALFAEPYGHAFYRGYVAQSSLLPARSHRVMPSIEAVSAPANLDPWVWTTGGLAVGLAAGAITTGVLAQRRYDDFERALDQTGQDDSAERAGIVTLRNWSNGLLIGAGALAATSATLWFFRGDASTPSVGVSPNAIGLQGRF